MSRNIKIELELPEFERELNISVTLKKDGEVISTSLSTSEKSSITENSSWKQEPDIQIPVEVPEKKTRKKSGGNMMDVSF